MPEDKKRTFDDDDLFQRKPYADFLKNLILNCDNYHRDDDVKAYTIALDSPWGTGKSIFLEKFEAMLEQDCQDQLRVVHYNAWENDFWDNAFEPFADAVFSHPLFASPLADQTTNRSVEKFGIAMKHLAVAFTKKQLENYFDSEQLAEAGSALAGAVGNYVSSDPNAVSPAYSAYKKNLQEMQAAMETVLQESIPDGKLVIIIDELDRCRPTFAIETLEIVKHVMDVPNVVYLFALDVQQLGAAIKKVYGAETDATSYLMRFFSYYSRLPDINIRKMVLQSIGDIKTVTDYTLIDKFEEVSSNFLLSARDIETIGKVYAIMMKAFLKDYNDLQAYFLYWILLCEKYKYPLTFAYDLCNRGYRKDEITTFLGRYQDPYIKNIYHLILTDQKLKDILWEGWEGDHPLPHIKTKIGFVGRVKLDEHSYGLEITNDGFPGNCVTRIDIDTNVSMSGLLFARDLLRWEAIRNLTPAQFLLQQIEMFNFLPTIE